MISMKISMRIPSAASTSLQQSLETSDFIDPYLCHCSFQLFISQASAFPQAPMIPVCLGDSAAHFWGLSELLSVTRLTTRLLVLSSWQPDVVNECSAYEILIMFLCCRSRVCPHNELLLVVS